MYIKIKERRRGQLDETFERTFKSGAIRAGRTGASSPAAAATSSGRRRCRLGSGDWGEGGDAMRFNGHSQVTSGHENGLIFGSDRSLTPP